jgi:hypothetical protein
VAYKLERISCAAAMARSEPAAAPPNAGTRPSSSIRRRTCSRCAPSASRMDYEQSGSYPFGSVPENAPASCDAPGPNYWTLADFTGLMFLRSSFCRQSPDCRQLSNYRSPLPRNGLVYKPPSAFQRLETLTQKSVKSPYPLAPRSRISR